MTRKIRVFGAKKDEVTGEWRRLHNEELHNLNSPPPDKKKPRVGWAGRLVRTGERKNAYRFRSETKGRRTLGLA